MLIDVLIPAYNAHKTIDKTLMSLAIQRLSHSLDVFIINDGSDSDYAEVVKPFEPYFHSLKIANLKENHGVGYCRNIALANTKNPYVFFIDSDDYMHSAFAFNELLQGLRLIPDPAVIYSNIFQELSECTTMESLTDFSNRKWIEEKGNRLYLHGKLYSRKFIMMNAITFPNIRSNEDIAFNTSIFTLAPQCSVIHLPNLIVDTICNPSSITRGDASTRRYSWGNVNEAWDAFTGMKHSFYGVRAMLKDQVNSISCNLYLQKYTNLYMRFLNSEFENDETKKLFYMICALYYKDIVMPICDVHGYMTRLPNTWGNTDYNWRWDNIKLKERPEINAWSTKALSDFSQDEFDTLAKKYLTSGGYK